MIYGPHGIVVNDDGSSANEPLQGKAPDFAYNAPSSPQLIDSAQSSNFVTGQSGWRITKEGIAEFSSGFFRGSITGASGTFGNLTINVTPNTIIVNDGTNDRVLIGYLAGKF